VRHVWDERSAGAFERQLQLAPLVLAAGVVREVRLTERVESLCRQFVAFDLAEELVGHDRR
jgi:hypothetical protein